MVEEVNMKNYTILAPFDKYYNGVADYKIQLLPSAATPIPMWSPAPSPAIWTTATPRWLQTCRPWRVPPASPLRLSTCAIPACSTSTSLTGRTAPPPLG
ncbi:hypothetical protein M5E87_25895 [Flavonifractor plautii]|nr:hypothetical protein M5E87_25895 [Flavonifractor plautii]